MSIGDGILSLDVAHSESPLSLFFACIQHGEIDEPRVGENASTDVPITNATTKVNIEEAGGMFQCGGVLGIVDLQSNVIIRFSCSHCQRRYEFVCSVFFLREKAREDFESCVFYVNRYLDN